MSRGASYDKATRDAARLREIVTPATKSNPVAVNTMVDGSGAANNPMTAVTFVDSPAVIVPGVARKFPNTKS